jgi:LSD1 subclass zinc finger protein
VTRNRAVSTRENPTDQRENVVRFDDYPRGRSARRGAADKLPGVARRGAELACPRCDALVRLESDLLAGAPEILCAACNAVIAVRPERVELRR